MPMAKEYLIKKADTERLVGPDERDPRVMSLGPCDREHEPEKNFRNNKFCMWSQCQVCALTLQKIPFKDAPGSSFKTGATPTDVAKALQIAMGEDNWTTPTAQAMQGYIKIAQGIAQSKHRQRNKADQKEREFDPEATATEQDLDPKNPGRKKTSYQKKKPMNPLNEEESVFPDNQLEEEIAMSESNYSFAETGSSLPRAAEDEEIPEPSTKNNFKTNTKTALQEYLLQSDKAEASRKANQARSSRG